MWLSTQCVSSNRWTKVTRALLPHLPRDLEDLAEEDALLELRGRAGEVARRVRAAEEELTRGLRRRATLTMRPARPQSAKQLVDDSQPTDKPRGARRPSMRATL